MRRYTLYIDHARRSGPIEFLIEVSGVARAREVAERMLAESDDHLGVEVCERGERLFGIGSFATRTWCGHRARRRGGPRRPSWRPPWGPLRESPWGPLSRFVAARQAREAGTG